MVNGDEDVMLIRSDGTIIRLHIAEIREIRETPRASSSCTWILDVKVVAACIVEHEEDALAETVDNSEILDNGAALKPRIRRPQQSPGRRRMSPNRNKRLKADRRKKGGPFTRARLLNAIIRLCFSGSR